MKEVIEFITKKTFVITPETNLTKEIYFLGLAP